MSTHIVGFRPADADWEKMYAVWDACMKANVPIPEEVDLYFAGKSPDEAGVQIDLHCDDETGSGAWRAVKRYTGLDAEGWEVDVQKLRAEDPTIKIIRFYSSY